MIISQLLRQATNLLAQLEIDNPRLEAEILLAHALSRKRSELILQNKESVTSEQEFQFLQIVRRRLSHEPISYITGIREFWSLDFAVTKDTLIPRPETELIVEKAIEYAKSNDFLGQRILDLGTGSGNIAVSLAQELPCAVVYAADISPAAITIARQNAVRHGVLDRCHFFVSDWFGAVNPSVLYNIIVSNPPYISTHEKGLMAQETLKYEPASALFSAQNGLADIINLISGVMQFLAPDGLFLCEIGFSQAGKLPGILHTRFNEMAFWFEKDLAGIERILCIKKRR